MKNEELKDVLVIDIETVSAKKNYSELPERMQKLWQKKSAYLKNGEDLNVAELYFRKAGIYAEFGKVITISLGAFKLEENQLSLEVRSLYNHDEQLLLRDFISLIERKFNTRKLRLCAHNGKEFDYPYLCRRMLVNGLKIPDFLDLRDKKPWEVQHLDTLDLWKFGDWKNYTSLDLLTALFNIESSKDTLDGSMVNECYYHEQGLEKIAHYCSEDVVATAQLFLKMHGKELLDHSKITFAA